MWKSCHTKTLGKICPRVPAMIAVDYERVFAEQAKKRQESGVNQYTDESLRENLPQASGKATDGAGICSMCRAAPYETPTRPRKGPSFAI